MKVLAEARLVAQIVERDAQKERLVLAERHCGGAAATAISASARRRAAILRTAKVRKLDLELVHRRLAPLRSARAIAKVELGVEPAIVGLHQAHHRDARLGNGAQMVALGARQHRPEALDAQRVERACARVGHLLAAAAEHDVAAARRRTARRACRADR